MIERVEDRELKRRSRRELLKLAPVAALGVFAFPKVSDWLVGEGVRFSDWAAGKLFRREHLAPTFSNASVVPFEKFPYNGYDVLDPEVDLEKWTLAVEGDVQHPGEYKLAQVQALTKIDQNTRHMAESDQERENEKSQAAPEGPQPTKAVADESRSSGSAAKGSNANIQRAESPADSVALEGSGEKSATAVPAAPDRTPELVRAAYEHPFAIRLTHWVNAVSVFVLVTSGLRIFRAFPSFGPKIPQQDLIDIPKALTLGGWLGGALQWHFTFMWLFAASGVVYLGYQVLSGHFRTVLFTPKDVRGVWPMARHYFFFGTKPPVTEQYNPLQKLAYTSTVGFGVLSFLTGLVLYKPAQFSWLAFLLGGFHLARGWHFFAMCGFVAFVPGHLIMVALHGWSNFYSMLSGWKREPEYQD